MSGGAGTLNSFGTINDQVREIQNKNPETSNLVYFSLLGCFHDRNALINGMK